MRRFLCVVGLILLLTTLTEGSAFRHPDRKELKGKGYHTVKPWSKSCINIAGVLITGSKPDLPYPYSTAELYLPSTGASCTLPSIPGYPGYSRWGHTVSEGGLICGGRWYSRDCLLWSPDTGTWEEDIIYLDVARYEHISWTPSSGNNGTYLMGGYLPLPGTLTTTLITSDGSFKTGFTLKYYAM